MAVKEAVFYCKETAKYLTLHPIPTARPPPISHLTLVSCFLEIVDLLLRHFASS